LPRAFLLAEAEVDRIRGFRIHQVEAILKDFTPVPLTSGVKVVLHLVPFSAFGLAGAIDIKKVVEVRHLLTPMGWSSCDYRYNFDGYLAYTLTYADSGLLSNSYAQIFRNGCIESVRVIQGVSEKYPKSLSGTDFERWIMESMPSYLELLKTLEIAPPILVMLSLLDTRGWSMVMGVGRHIIPRETNLSAIQEIDRDRLLVPEIVLEDYRTDITVPMQVAFDTIWNAAGWSRSPVNRTGTSLS